jgi:hypothetical protein
MRRIYREQMQTFRDLGFEILGTEPGGRHLKALVRRPDGACFKISLVRHAGGRALLNQTAQLRRLLKERSP